MNPPLVFSVVIPTYNREPFLEKTLESVFNQRYPHYEIIVVDNCSTDGTVEVLAPYVADGKITFIKHEQNFERARSRNTGMENARGDFLTFLDSDDFMLPDNLFDAAEFAKTNPDLKCFHNLYYLVDGKGITVQKYRFPRLGNRLAEISNGNFLSCIGDFIHRDIYTHYRFDTYHDLTGGEDWEFWLRVLADFEVGRIEKYNSAVQHHGERSIMNQDIDSMERGLKYMIDKFRRDSHLSEVYADFLDRIEANSFLYLNLLANDGRQRARAFDYLKASFRKDTSIAFTMRFLRSLRRTAMNFS